MRFWNDATIFFFLILFFSTPATALKPDGCESGFFHFENQTACKPCQGSIADLGTINESCTACPAGTFTIPGQEGCFAPEPEQQSKLLQAESFLQTRTFMTGLITILFSFFFYRIWIERRRKKRNAKKQEDVKREFVRQDLIEDGELDEDEALPKNYKV